MESDVDRVPVSPELRLVASFGTIGDGGPEEFHQISDVEILDATHIAVADRGSEEVRVFGLDGTHLTSFGGQGSGPREYRGLSLVQAVADSIFTYDTGNGRVAVRTRSGAFVRSYRLEWFSGLLFPVEIAPDGSALAVTASHMTELQGVGRLVDESLVSTYDADGALIDSLGRVPQNERFVRQIGDRRTTVRAPFTAEAGLVRLGSGFCHAFGPAPEVRCYGPNGELEAIWRLSLPRRPVTEPDIDRYWSTLLDEADGPYRQVLLGLRGDLTFPEWMPAFSALLLGDDGVLWARRYQSEADQESAWWLFDPEGRVAGRVDTPAGFEVMDTGRGLVAGVWRDELGVEHVRVYRR